VQPGPTSTIPVVAETSTRLEGLTYPKELLINLTLRELRSKYKRSTLGWAWSVINPLTTILVYTVVFSLFLRVAPPVGDPSGIDSYAFFLMTGLLPWLFLSNGITGSVGSLTGNEGLIKKVYFPRSVLPTASVFSHLAGFAIELGVLAALLIVIGGNMVLPWVPILLLVVAIQVVFVLGLGLILSPVNAYFRDVEHFTVIFLNVWFWATPILYPEEVLSNPDGSPKEFGPFSLPALMNLNPMAHFVTAYRDLFYNLRFPALTTWLAMLVSAAVAMILGVVIFRRLEGKLAEEL
jgi:ABC-type polysaccharide/polyol phosphate export permease